MSAIKKPMGTVARCGGSVWERSMSFAGVVWAPWGCMLALWRLWRVLRPVWGAWDLGPCGGTVQTVFGVCRGLCQGCTTVKGLIKVLRALFVGSVYVPCDTMPIHGFPV